MANAKYSDPIARMHVVVESPEFAADAKAAGLGEADLCRIIDRVAERPDVGDVVPGTGGARRVRSPDAARARAAATG